MLQFLQVSKATKGERLIKKVMIERTHDEETMKKSTRRSNDNLQMEADYLRDIQELCGGRWSPTLEPSLDSLAPLLQSTQELGPSEMGPQP
jgi:ATP sulfurylase